MNSYSLNLEGPFKFYGKNNLFLNQNGIGRGIYFWTIKQKDKYLINYIGMTTKTFNERNKKHICELLSGNYHIYNIEEAMRSIEKIEWNGKWDENKTDPESFGKFMENIDYYNRMTMLYLKEVDVFYLDFGENPDKTHVETFEWKIATELRKSEHGILLHKGIRYRHRLQEKNTEIILNITNPDEILELKTQYIVNKLDWNLTK
jgi:hypothetical protein